MAGRGFRLAREGCSRRALLLGLGAACLVPRPALAFGQAGVFHPRLLVTGGRVPSGARATGPGRWAWEVIQRTSAPARLGALSVAADRSELLAEPFVLWIGETEVPPLTGAELRGLQRFLRLGGVLVVDDSNPERGAFATSVRRELARVLPEAPLVKLGADHVIYKTFYLIDRPVGRVLGAPYVEAVVRNRNAQVVLLSHDLMGALARGRNGGWALEVTPGGPRQREHAVRLAVNLAMYLLCSDYKDDQVHAPWLMRRRAPRSP